MKLMDANTMQTTQIANFAFSGVRPDKLGNPVKSKLVFLTSKM